MDWTSVLLQGLWAAAGTFCFAVRFHVQPRHYIGCALDGCVGWVVYVLALAAGTGTAMASFIAAIPMALFARQLAIQRKTPATVYLLCGIFPLVPGAGIYHTAYAFFLGDSAAFTAYGAETLKVALALAVGIALVLALPRWARIKKLLRQE